jgi:tRNA threonylcarbamoyladenosine biosynthesis protein TsaE
MQAAQDTGFEVQMVVTTADQMRALGERLARALRAGDLVVLSGPLGAGKTTLAQGIGAGLGVRGPVTSPTFVIARVHPSLHGGPDLVHADAYRLGSRAEVDDLDLDADTDSAVTIVEWGEGLVEDLAASMIAVAIERQAGGAGGALAGTDAADDQDEPRGVRVTGWGARWADAAAEVRAALAASAT